MHVLYNFNERCAICGRCLRIQICMHLEGRYGVQRSRTYFIDCLIFLLVFYPVEKNWNAYIIFQIEYSSLTTNFLNISNGFDNYNVLMNWLFFINIFLREKCCYSWQKNFLLNFFVLQKNFFFYNIFLSMVSLTNKDTYLVVCLMQ